MYLLSILIFAVSANMDNFAVGLSYGVKTIRISLKSNLIIGLITFLGTALSMSVGKSLLLVIPASAAGVLGGAIITAIGCFYLIKFIWDKSANAYERYDKDNSGDIDWREAIGLGLALSANNIGLGVSASITGLNVTATSICSLFFSLLFIYISNILGKSCVSKFLGKYSEPAASVLIIILGVYEMFG